MCQTPPPLLTKHLRTPSGRCSSGEAVVWATGAKAAQAGWMESQRFQSAPTLIFPIRTNPKLLFAWIMYHACVYTAVVPNILFLYKITRGCKAQNASLVYCSSWIKNRRSHWRMSAQCSWSIIVCGFSLFGIGKPGVTWEFITRKVQDSCHLLMVFLQL